MPDQYRNTIQDQRLTNMEKHIEVINSELSGIKTELATLKEKVSWLCKTYWIMMTAVIGTLVATLFGLLGK